MAYAVKDGGYTYDDLDWLRDEVGDAHLELDPRGALIVTPASDEHERAVAKLHGQAVAGLGLPYDCVLSNGIGWKVPGGSGYLNVPDLVVVDPAWTRVGDLHLDPPPLLLVEVGSASTRSIDRSRKLADYRLGGAGVYVLVDLPDTFEVHDFATGQVTNSTGAVYLVIAGRPLRFDLTDLA